MLLAKSYQHISGSAVKYQTQVRRGEHEPTPPLLLGPMGGSTAHTQQRQVGDRVPEEHSFLRQVPLHRLRRVADCSCRLERDRHIVLRQDSHPHIHWGVENG